MHYFVRSGLPAVLTAQYPFLSCLNLLLHLTRYAKDWTVCSHLKQIWKLKLKLKNTPVSEIYVFKIVWWILLKVHLNEWMNESFISSLVKNYYVEKRAWMITQGLYMDIILLLAKAFVDRKTYLTRMLCYQV